MSEDTEMRDERVEDERVEDTRDVGPRGGNLSDRLAEAHQQQTTTDERRTTESDRAAAEPRAALFASDRAADLRSRWSEVQGRFVDDPRAAVKEADGLVDDVIQQLAKQFADERSRLEGQWGRDEKVSTEDLRVALQRYREFFERLLSM